LFVGKSWRRLFVFSTAALITGILLAATPAQGSEIQRAPAPLGHVDSISVSGANATVSGWTFDPNQPDVSIQVHIYVFVDGRVNSGSAFVADDNRPDVNQVFSIPGRHGFSRSVKLVSGWNVVCSYGISPIGGNTVLGPCLGVIAEGDESSYQVATSASFDGLPLGPVAPASFNNQVGAASKSTGAYDDMTVAADGSRSGSFLRTILRAGTIHSQPGGDNGNNLFIPLSRTYERACLQYDIRFDAGFDFSLGGKLPGLEGVAPGVRPAVPTGGGITDLGWSGRLMWLGPKAYKWAGPSNMIVSYLYHPTQAGEYGDNIRWNQPFLPGQWHTVKQCYVMNTVGQANGRLTAWLDGTRVVLDTNFVYRTRSDVAINHLVFSIFRGGNTLDWAGARDGYVDIDNLLITYG
jgi:hypothetical protein